MNTTYFTPATMPPEIDECPGHLDPTDLWSLDESVATAYAELNSGDQS